VSDITGGFGAFSKVLRMVLQSAVLAVGAFLVIEQEATAGIIIAASILAGRALAPVDLAISQYRSFMGARQSWARLSTLLALLPQRADPLPLPSPESHVALQEVYVAAPGTKKPILESINFSVEAGGALGIIGPTGSGKSSLLRAIVGVWQPLSGRIRLDGADLDQWSSDDLGRNIGYLPQDVELFGGTISENIARFDDEAQPEQIIAAAKAAGVHDLIVSLREGYDTQIGEQGQILSAGQRQRVALARALYRDPFLVVLDEPNSNLDGEGEAALNEAILGVRSRGGIVLIVAHRPSALLATDRLLVIDRGRVQAFGPKDAVLATLYPKLQSVTPEASPGVSENVPEKRTGT
jgi:ATP-binding cassette subfamily C protein